MTGGQPRNVASPPGAAESPDGELDACSISSVGVTEPASGIFFAIPAVTTPTTRSASGSANVAELRSTRFGPSAGAGCVADRPPDAA
jgi:hypothetical protein